MKVKQTAEWSAKVIGTTIKNSGMQEELNISFENEGAVIVEKNGYLTWAELIIIAFKSSSSLGAKGKKKSDHTWS
jgi:hypothetical protein